MARSLFQDLKAEEMAAAVLIRFCASGDTRHEAGDLAAMAAGWVALTETPLSEWQAPHSWNLCYGTGPPLGVF
jgi:hypothetical protein